MNLKGFRCPQQVAYRLLLPALSLTLSTGQLTLKVEHQEKLSTGDLGGAQSVFAMEGVPVSRPVDLPEDAIQVMRRNPFVLSCLEEGWSPGNVPTKWFVASEIRLRNTRKTDLVVLPREGLQGPNNNGCLYHPHSMPFWVLTKASAGYKLVLEDNAQVLRVLNTMTNGCHDIETSILTTVGQTRSFFVFDGHEYKLKKRITIGPQ
jgi:hypothetical protein